MAVDVKALTFDTGGTILDWHGGMRRVFEDIGKARGVDADWVKVVNEYRRASLKKMLNAGGETPATYNIDGAHRMTLPGILSAHGLDAFTEADHDTIVQGWHGLKTWTDFPAVLPRLREKYICASFTILSVRLIIDTARANGLSWDAVISCETIGTYKVRPEAYATCAKWLQLDPSECLMVACHNFDLDAAKAAGFKTAFVRRPDEWGPEGPPDPKPNPIHDIIVDDFPGLAAAVGVAV